MAVEISEPLSGSEPRFRTIHEIKLNGKCVGTVDVGYMTEKDAKMLRGYSKGKLKREFKAGKPFGVKIFIDAQKCGVSAKQIGLQGLREIVEAIKERFEGLEDQDIYVLEVTAEGKKPLGKGENLNIA